MLYFLLVSGTLAPPASSIRLVGASSSPSSGNVEILHNGTYKPVCDDDWDLDDARVACRQLGFADATTETARNHFNSPAPKGLFAMDDVRCTGLETRLEECAFDGWDKSNCLAGEQAGVECSVPTTSAPVTTVAPTPAMRIRLAGVGSAAHQGRVEVFHNGQWGTVCDDSWTISDADVACRQLGFPAGAVSETVQASFGRGSGPIWMSHLVCQGSEAELRDCVFSGWGVHSCNHGEDAGVVCGKIEENYSSYFIIYVFIYFRCAVSSSCSYKTCQWAHAKRRST